MTPQIHLKTELAHLRLAFYLDGNMFFHRRWLLIGADLEYHSMEANADLPKLQGAARFTKWKPMVAINKYSLFVDMTGRKQFFQNEVSVRHGEQKVKTKHTDSPLLKRNTAKWLVSTLVLRQCKTLGCFFLLPFDPVCSVKTSFKCKDALLIVLMTVGNPAYVHFAFFSSSRLSSLSLSLSLSPSPSSSSSDSPWHGHSNVWLILLMKLLSMNSFLWWRTEGVEAQLMENCADQQIYIVVKGTGGRWIDTRLDRKFRWY